MKEKLKKGEDDMLLINDKKAIEKYNLEQNSQDDNNVIQETESERYIRFLRVILVILKIIFIIVGIVIASQYFSMSEQEKLLTSITDDIFISFMLIYVITCILITINIKWKILMLKNQNEIRKLLKK